MIDYAIVVHSVLILVNQIKYIPDMIHLPGVRLMFSDVSMNIRSSRLDQTEGLSKTEFLLQWPPTFWKTVRKPFSRTLDSHFVLLYLDQTRNAPLNLQM